MLCISIVGILNQFFDVTLQAAVSKHCAALLETARRTAATGEARLAEVTREHAKQLDGVEELKKKVHVAKEALRRGTCLWSSSIV